jgi:hypothetical protein
VNAPTKLYGRKSVRMKYLGTWVEPALHKKLKELAKVEDITLAKFIRCQLERVAAGAEKGIPEIV